MRNNFKLVITLVLVILVIMMAGCSEKTSVQEPSKDNSSEVVVDNSTDDDKTAEEINETSSLSGKIVVGTNMTNVVDTTLKDLADEFMAINPGTEIEFEGIKDPANVLTVRMAANELPDLSIVLKTLKQSDYSEYYVPLNDLGFTNDNIAFYDQGFGNDGNLYIIPLTMTYKGVVYNKSVFEKAGIESLPRTQEEFLAICEKIKGIGVVPVASNFKDLWPLNGIVEMLPVAWNANPSYFNDLVISDEMLKDDNGYLASLEFLSKLNENGYLEPDLMSTNWDASKREFAQGNIGMMILGSWLPLQIVDNGASVEEIGMFPAPDAKGVILAPEWKYGISKYSENIELAKAFMIYLWENGRYAAAVSQSPSSLTVSPSEVFVKELLSFDLPLIFEEAFSDEYNLKISTGEINTRTIAQEYVFSNNKQEVIDKYNKKWKDAK